MKILQCMSGGSGAPINRSLKSLRTSRQYWTKGFQWNIYFHKKVYLQKSIYNYAVILMWSLYKHFCFFGQRDAILRPSIHSLTETLLLNHIKRYEVPYQKLWGPLSKAMRSLVKRYEIPCEKFYQSEKVCPK